MGTGRTAAIVLAGGFSRRMGEDKATLPFGPETLVERVARLAAEAVDEVVVVAREGQALNVPYPIARDPAEGLGPLAGLAAGLAAVGADRAFLTACDAPFLRRALVRRLLELGAGHPLAVPLVEDRHMVTTAVYGKEVLTVARELLEAGRLRPVFLVDAFPGARIVTEEELRDVDPELESFRNCNTPEAYEAALRDAGFAAGR